MWEQFDLDRIEAEIRAMRAMGCDVCRSFLFLPSFLPSPPTVDPTMMERLGKFFALCEKHDLQTIPTLLVGHMSGQNFDFPGQRGRSPYTDRDVVSWEIALADTVGSVGAQHRRAIVAWALSNEMPLWAGPTDPDTVRTWARNLVGVLHRAAPGIPVGAGDGVMNLKGGQNGFDPAVLAESVDFLGPHSYYADRDALRHALRIDFILRALLPYGKPVLLEEFGASATQASEAAQAAYYRETMHAAFTLGAAGALGWCYGDFDLDRDVPYVHHPFELSFGVVHTDGSKKPAADEIRDAAHLFALAGAPTGLFAEASAPAAAIVVPSYFWRDYPFSSEDRARMQKTLLQAYAMAILAGLDPGVMPEELVARQGRVKLWIVPATQKLLSATWSELVRRARDGATVYASYYASDFDFHQGMWWDERAMEQAIGARHRLRYGVLNHPGDRVVLKAGKRALISCPVPPPYADEPMRSSFLPLEPTTAKTLLRDDKGRPALLANAVGKGRWLFNAFAVEYLLTLPIEPNASGATGALYALLARAAGIAPARVPPGVVVRKVGDLSWIMNRTWRSQTLRSSALGAGRWVRVSPTAGAREAKLGSTIALGPKAVVVARRTG